jgi:signal transduction histidine kinase
MTDAEGGAILILDDDPGIAKLEALRLRRAGHEAIVAHAPAEALEAIRKGPVGLMLLDYHLEGEASGLDFFLGLQGEGLVIPAILVTGFGDEAVLTQAMRAGIRDFLPKTSDYLDYLLPTVARVLAQVRTERQLEQERANLIREQAAREEAEAASRRKDEFLATLAHEIRNPLAAISNAVQLSRNCGRDPATLDWAGEVLDRQVKHLGRLLEDLLDVSRIALGKIQLRKQSLDARDIVAGAIEATRTMVEARGHSLALAIDPEPLRVEADPTRLEQVLVNLLANAAKYTEPGGSIRVAAGREDGQAILRVRDSGMGLAPEKLPLVFDLFEQVDHSIDRSEGGLGIGLTLVRKLAELHGGSASAESAGLGKGSEFTVRLPLVAAGAPGAAAGAGPPTSSDPSRRRILVVDDNRDSARGMARLLAIGGHEVRVAHDGPEAIAAAESDPFDFILLDIGLPGLDGYEVTRRLRGGGRCERTMFIAVSGYGQAEDRRRSREAGMDHHLVKPVEYEALVKILAQEGAPAAPAGRP